MNDGVVRCRQLGLFVTPHRFIGGEHDVQPDDLKHTLHIALQAIWVRHARIFEKGQWMHSVALHPCWTPRTSPIHVVLKNEVATDDRKGAKIIANQAIDDLDVNAIDLSSAYFDIVCRLVTD